MAAELEVAARPQREADPPPRGLLGTVVRHLVYPFRRGAVPARHTATGFYTDTTVCIGCKACEVACKQWNQLPADGFTFTGNSYDNTGSLSAESWRHVKFVEQFESVDRSLRERTGDPGPGGTASSGGEPQPLAERADHIGRVSLDVVTPPANRWLMMSDVCKHCVAAPCEHACPTGAIVYNEFGNVYIQPDICNGCAYCIAACPFGVITRSHFDGHAHKCTLCYDRQKDGLVPACAKACPTASIQFGPIDELREKARKRVAELHGRGVPGAYLYGDAPTEAYTELHSFYLLVDRPAVYGLPDTPVNPWVRMLGDYARAAGVGLVGLLLAAAVLLFGGTP
jgi:formate dehydrogenase iron-sulfur subunit